MWMTGRETTRVLMAALLWAIVSISVSAQTSPAATQGSKTATRAEHTSPKPQGESMIQHGGLKLTEGEKLLAEGSRKAILNTGISAPYFEKHFRLVRVFDKMGDRRVVWKFNVNEYEATVNDAVGFYTDGGKRVDVNSVTGTLAATHEIQKTITRREAERAMRACIGEFTDGGVTYAAYGGVSPRATLMLNGSSVVKPPTSAEKRREAERREKEEREREARERRAKKNSRDKKRPPVDVEEEEDEGRKLPVIYVGVVDLETGKCIKGRALAGPPQP
jgi:hypothetical protein